MCKLLLSLNKHQRNCKTKSNSRSKKGNIPKLTIKTMKKITYILLIIISTIACNKQKDNPQPKAATNPVVSPTPTSSQSDFWGCWKHISQNPQVYDIILTENTNTTHGFQFATKCIPNQQTPQQDIGVFRNDTLIFDNGNFEYWCYIENDTLSYGAYFSGAQQPELFIK